MPLPKTCRAFAATREMWAEVDWIEGRRGGTWHALLTRLLAEWRSRPEQVKFLGEQPLPDGFGGTHRDGGE